MKKSLCYFTFFAGTAIGLFSCQKVNSVSDDEINDKKKPKKDFCLISSFGYSNSAIPVQTVFANHYDLAGRSLQVEAGVFSGGSIVSNMVFNVVWASNGIAFIDANEQRDTILIATFGRKGRIEKIVPGNKPNFQFVATSFDYNKSQLSAMHTTISSGSFETAYFDYDTKGNLISITDAPTTSVPIPGKVEYGYTTNEKANDQFYFDEPRKFSWNSFSLLQYVGLFPELQPVNLRTSTKVSWGNNYQVYHMNIANQQLDNQGKLVSYDVASPSSGTVVSHFNINWSCNLSDLVQNPN